jgi:hypothetical protein
MNVPEVIGRIVDSMRDDGSYTSWSKVGTTYTIVAENELLEDEWISLNDSDEFQATNVSSSSFDIISSSDPDATGTYKSLEPFFMFGHRREISNRLLMKGKDDVFKYQKYPLFALRLPINETVDGDVHDVSLNIAILAFTQKKYRAQERYDNVITPILVPLYTEFLQKVRDSFELMISDLPDHEKVDRPFYGISGLEGNEAYIFNDPLDGIELVDLELKLLDNNC